MRCCGCFFTFKQVAVKAFGPNSLSSLKLRGSAGATVSQLLSGKAPPGSAGGSSSSSNSVTMALKLAPHFHNTSWEVQVSAVAAAVKQV
jgi:hypothetical protein